MLLHPSPAAGVSRHSAVASDHWLAVLAKLMDAALILGVLLGAVGVYSSTWDLKYTVAPLLAALAFLVVAELSGLYRPWRGATLKRQFFHVLFVGTQTVLLLRLVAYASKASKAYSRVAVGLWLVDAPLPMLQSPVRIDRFGHQGPPHLGEWVVLLPNGDGAFIAGA